MLFLVFHQQTVLALLRLLARAQVVFLGVAASLAAAEAAAEAAAGNYLVIYS